MKERRYIKLRSDMYEDTKFKIIDKKPERDTIHYVWTRLLTLAAKINLRGDLFMSRNLPYTIETLAIELNRSEEQIKLAIEVFLELEMMELIEGRIYRVKNFAKHQNIKAEEKVKSEAKEINVKNIELATESVVINEGCNKEEKKSDKEEDDKMFENNVAENEKAAIINDDKRALEVNISEINKENNMSREISDNISQNNIPIPFKAKKNKKAATKKKKEKEINVTDEEEGENEEMFSIKNGEFVLGEGEKIVSSWTF